VVICEYTFPVKGTLRTRGTHPVPLGSHIVSFLTSDSDRVTAVSVRVKIDNPAHWPKAVPTNSGPGKWHLDVPSPGWDDLRDRLRVLEGLLTSYGLDEICIDGMSKEWIPETAEEKESLGVTKIQVSNSARPDTEFPLVGFAVMARSVMAVDDVRDLDVALSFFRRGRLDMLSERYIEAYYDYFFVLETLYGSGKARKDALAAEFAASPLLVEVTRKVMHGESLARFIAERPASIQRINEKYVRATPAEVLASLIETRGFLHHHSAKRPNSWHPEKQAQFECDAIIIEEIALQLLFRRTAPYIFSKEAEDRYRDFLIRSRI
jgi:hypothetical protein